MLNFPSDCECWSWVQVLSPAIKPISLYNLGGWLKCSKAIMVESAQETGVDPLMKFSDQKNTFPPEAKSPPITIVNEMKWKNCKFLERARKKLHSYLTFVVWIIDPVSTWVFISKTNTDFTFGWNYIWQRVAAFGNIFPQILEFQSSNGVTECQDIAVWNYGII